VIKISRVHLICGLSSTSPNWDVRYLYYHIPFVLFNYSLCIHIHLISLILLDYGVVTHCTSMHTYSWDLFNIDQSFSSSHSQAMKSLPWNERYVLCLRYSQEGASAEHRIKVLSGTLQNYVYMYVCRSLFKVDRLMFALHMVHGMLPNMFQENVSLL